MASPLWVRLFLCLAGEGVVGSGAFAVGFYEIVFDELFDFGLGGALGD